MVYKVEQNKNMKLTIPYYLHKAGAGFPSPATDYIEEDIDLNMHLIRNVPATFIIRVQGKSMVDVGINDGDLLVVDKSLKPKNFSTVIANVHDELVVKTLVQERDKKFLTSGSKEFSDRILINEEQDIFIFFIILLILSTLIAIASNIPNKANNNQVSKFIYLNYLWLKLSTTIQNVVWMFTF